MGEVLPLKTHHSILMLLVVHGALACSGSTFSSASGGGAGGSGAGTTGGATSTGGAGTTGGGTGTGGFNTSGVMCSASPPSFPAFEKGCTTTDNCLLVSHQTNCCGSILMMGINHAEADRFAALEKVCESQYPACGCASSTVAAEDGTTVPLAAAAKIVVTCDTGKCVSQYSGQTFGCGTSTCTDMQYCSTVTSATGAQPTYSCVDLPVNCTGCTCIPVAPTCTCADSGGLATVTCTGP